MAFGNPLIPTELSALRRLNARARAETINLGLGQPAVDMHPRLRELAPAALAKHKLGYTPNAGLPALRDKVASRYGLDPATLLITHGAQEGLMATLLALLTKGDEVLLPDPGFLAYETMVKIAGGKARFYSLKHEGSFCYSAKEILRSVTKRTRAVLICSPNNPTGTMIAPAERALLLRELAKKKVFLISDDVYAELAFSSPYRPVSAESPYGITVSSWSKSLALTGWRIGFVHSTHPAFSRKALAAHQYLTTCASAPAQALLLEALTEPGLYDHVLAGFRDEYEAKLRRLLAFLPEKHRPELPGGGFYLFLKLPSRSDTRAVDLLLVEKNLLVVPGSYFGREGKGWARVSVAAPNEALDRAGAILAALWTRAR
jgi:aminotransferase